MYIFVWACFFCCIICLDILHCVSITFEEDFYALYIVNYVFIFRKPSICQPNLDESSWSDEYQTNLMTSDGHRAKVVRKSRKAREQKALSFNCKHRSVAVQTGSDDVSRQQPQPVFGSWLVSTGMQTDDVIVINVSRRLHASSDVPGGLFSSGHSGLLPAIHISDVDSATGDRDTDSGHMSESEIKLLTEAASDSFHLEEAKKDILVQKSVPTLPVYRDSIIVPAVSVVQDVTTSARLTGCENNHKSAAIENSAPPATSQDQSLSERGLLSRWTTATRLDVLDENDDVERRNSQTKSFFASLDTSRNRQAALNDVDVSGISVLSAISSSNVPLLSSTVLSVDGQTVSTVSHSDVIMPSNGTQPQSSLRVSQLSSSSDNKPRFFNSPKAGSIARPSAGSRRRISKGSQQSSGKPRLSVGRKSLSKRRSTTVRTPTKISRPAAWLMSATKATRGKVCHMFIQFYRITSKKGKLLRIRKKTVV